MLRWVLVFNGPVRGASGSGLWALGVGTVGAAKLQHEVPDHPMKMQTVVKTTAREVEEVLCGFGHLVAVDLGAKVAFRGLKFDVWIGHGLVLLGVNAQRGGR